MAARDRAARGAAQRRCRAARRRRGRRRRARGRAAGRPRRDLLDAPAPAAERPAGVAPHLGAARHEEHAHPRARALSRRATTKPSPPLLPLPHTTPRACRGSGASHAGDQRGRARRPAFSMSRGPGMPSVADGARVERPHLGGGEDGQHGVSAGRSSRAADWMRKSASTVRVDLAVGGPGHRGSSMCSARSGLRPGCPDCLAADAV